jgi:hypothetical protein
VRPWWRALLRVPGAAFFAAMHTAFVVGTDILAHLGLVSLASGICRCAVRVDRDAALMQLAYVRCHAGDLEGALSLLGEAVPSDEHLFFRELHSALMCQQHKQNVRAAAYFQGALAAPVPVRVTPEWRSQMEKHVLRLRELGDGVSAG